jgi:ATP-dependent Clp protease protease subunit
VTWRRRLLQWRPRWGVLAAGTKGKRSTLPNTRMLLHQPSVGGSGSQVSADVEIHARELMRTKKRMNELQADNTGQPFEKIGRDTNRDYMLGAHEAVKYGLIERGVTPGRKQPRRTARAGLPKLR